jgi:hypothetical protein
MAAATPQLDNLTETLQKHLGIEQAQTFAPEDITADAIARLTGKRGDVARLRQLWDRATAHELVDGWRPGDHQDALEHLRRVLDANLVVQRGRDGVPKTFRPLVPEMVNSERPSTLYRDLGRTVVDVLWRGDELRDQLRSRIAGWRTRHPLAMALAPLCGARDIERSSPTSRLGAILLGEADPGLAEWVRSVVADDWRTWLRASETLSVDEQIETMTALACLHLHVALLWRLWDQGERAVVFVAVAGQDMERACARAAYNTYGFWGDRSYEALRVVADRAVQRAGSSVPGWERVDTPKDLAGWASVEIDRGRSANARFHQRIKETLADPPQDLRAALVKALVDAFSTQSGVTTKVKDYLRGTGRAVGLVGPDTYRSRKRYQIDERAISLLARLHVHRDYEGIRTSEDERHGVDALLDDVFYRYGLVVTRERGPIREALQAPTLRPIAGRFPGDEAMRRNRLNLERRLDELRLVRRYSDASAVLHVV